MRTRGTLELILGNMFAGKTSELIHNVEDARTFAREESLVFKPVIDTRSPKGFIEDRHGRKIDAIEITDDPDVILRIIEEREVQFGGRFKRIVFDEMQFLKNASFPTVDALLDYGYNVLAAGLMINFRREVFRATADLVALSQNSQHIRWLRRPSCAICKAPADLPQRLIDGKVAPYDSDEFMVGGEKPEQSTEHNTTYEPRCFQCHQLPGWNRLYFT